MIIVPETTEGEYNKWKYKILYLDNGFPFKIEIQPALEISPPKELCKYFSFENYNVEALACKYFYGSHPSDLNDPFDLNKNMLNLDIQSTNSIYQFIFSYFGILSMTESDTDPLMWSHYSSHKGFVIKYSIDKIPDNFFGPFPINYIEDFEPILTNNLFLKFLIASNIKYKGYWSAENEWRFLLYSPTRIRLPKYFSDLLDYKDRSYKPRYFDYSDYFSIKEAILGFKLLLNDKVKFQYDQNIGIDVMTKDNLLIKFLNLLYKEKIRTYIVDIHPTKYPEFVKREISINIVRKNKFILKFID
jgi:hypothetical protein